MQQPKLLTLICYFLIGCSVDSLAQEVILTFYDSTWRITSKDSAFYVTQNTKVGEHYQKKTYFLHSEKLYSVSTGPDLLIRGKKIGLALTYFRNGMTRDSSFYNLEGQPNYVYSFYDDGKLSDAVFYGSKFFIDSARHYYRSGKLKAHYVNDRKSKYSSTKGFDEAGNEIKDYIYSKEAEFKGGQEGWRNFLRRNLDPNVPVKNGAPAGTYHVIARFVISADGTISDIVYGNAPRIRYGGRSTSYHAGIAYMGACN